MKKLTLFLIFVANYGYSQIKTYTFNNLTTSVFADNSYGESEKTIISEERGRFKFEFEYPNDGKTKDIFTIIGPDDNPNDYLPWFGHLKDLGYKKGKGKVYKEMLYFYTKANDSANVLIAMDFSQIIIFHKDGLILDYSR